MDSNHQQPIGTAPLCGTLHDCSNLLIAVDLTGIEPTTS